MRVLVSIFTLLISFSICGHGGGTDRFGGHHNRRDNSYHYHHGNPAHLHETGICPYDNMIYSSTHRRTAPTQSSRVFIILGYGIVGLSLLFLLKNFLK